MHSPDRTSGHASRGDDPPSSRNAGLRGTSAEEGAGQQAAPTGTARGITWRVIIIAVLVAPLNTYFMAFLLGPRGVEDPTVVSLFYNVVFLLVVFRLINAVLLRYAPGLAFSPAELVTFFILLSVATCPAGLDTMKTTFATMHGPARFASDANRWDELFGDQLPESMMVSDPRALERLWEGESSIFDPRNYQVWIGPAFHWWLLYSCLWTAPAGLAVLLRKRWVERERMRFPIVQLPYELSRPGVPALRHVAFWIAVGAVVAINLLNGLHEFFPSLPVIAVKIGQSDTMNLRRFFVGQPWGAVGRFHLCLYPFIIGLGLLLPTELSLSLWAFYLFWKAQAILVAWLGWTDVREFPFMKEQSFGGYLAILGFSLWAARRHFAGVWRRILTGREGEDDSEEPVSYRWAAGVFAAGAVAAVMFGTYIKMSPAVAIAFFVQYYAMTIIVGRIRAEMGLPTHEIERLGPTVMQGNILGPRVLGVQNLTSLSLFFGFTRGLRNIPFPHQFEGLYLAKQTGGEMRRMLFATMAMIPLGVGLAFFFTLYLGYRHGLGAEWARWMPWSCQEAWRQLANWLVRDETVQWGRIWASVIGFGVYFGLMLVRTWWIWWPLHPAGFAISTTWYMAHMWFPMCIAWTAKTVIARYAGPRAMRALTAAAFGLILGDVVSGCLWTLYGLAFHVTTYSFWP
jgi:hypothetical protein